METTVQLVKGAIATIFVKDMDRAVKFYTETLGCKLAYRAGGHWASIDAGDGVAIGLYPAGEGPPMPGVQGGVQIGFNVTAPMEKVVAELESRGVSFPNGIHDDTEGESASRFSKTPTATNTISAKPRAKSLRVRRSYSTAHRVPPRRKLDASCR